MVYFEPNTGWPEQLGKIMGDAFAAAMVVSVLVLVTSSMCFDPKRTSDAASRVFPWERPPRGRSARLTY